MTCWQRLMTRLRATSQITGKRTEVFDPAWCRLLLDNSSESWLTCWGVGVTELTCSIFDKRLTMCLLPAQFSIVGELWNGLRSASEVCCGPSTCDQVCVMCISTLIGSSVAPCVVGSPALCHSQMVRSGCKSDSGNSCQASDVYVKDLWLVSEISTDRCIAESRALLQAAGRYHSSEVQQN